MRLRRLFKPIWDRAIPPIWRWYVSKPRTTRMEGLKLWVPVGVFHPKLLLSTRFMVSHLRGRPLKGKTLLEIGTGSGVIGIVAAKLGAQVTVTDINKAAVEAANRNAASNAVEIRVLESDLFVNLPSWHFDFIAVNPPYFPKEPQTEAEHAWFCGLGFGYFERFFAGLSRYCHPLTVVLMVLSEDCNLDEIARIATKHGWQMQEVDRRRRFGEWNLIYSITKSSVQGR